MKLTFRCIVLCLGLISLINIFSGCASEDSKKFIEISRGFGMGEKLLKNETGVIAVASAANPDQNLFKVGAVIDRSIMTDELFRQDIESYLVNVASFTT
ncbi:MAG: hypothetical protein ACYC2T_09060 [Bacillota bacterium]